MQGILRGAHALLCFYLPEQIVFNMCVNIQNKDILDNCQILLKSDLQIVTLF